MQLKFTNVLKIHGRSKYMGLNKVKPNGNMYEFLTHTWNIIKGIGKNKYEISGSNI